MTPTSKWTVIGLYPETGEQFADHVTAASALEAYDQVLRVRDENMVDIAGVVKGTHVLEGCGREIRKVDET